MTDELKDIASITKRKTADESVTSSLTLQDDDHLTFTIAANEEWVAVYDLGAGALLSTTGIQLAVTAPAGATLDVIFSAIGTTGEVRGSFTTTSGGQFSVSPAQFPVSSSAVFHIRAWVLNGATPGSVTLQFAQQTSSVTAVTVRKGSSMNATRVA